MRKSISTQRAAMPAGTNRVLDARSIGKSNANLLEVLKPGQTVLDVGCGSGAITSGICDYVGTEGQVIGVDRSDALINQAIAQYAALKNLSFYCADILAFNTHLRFDVVTAARTLQWVARPHQLLLRMQSLLANNGVLCVLDYDHTAIAWNPSPPASMLYFYEAFLRWRADAGMDNQAGIHAAGLMERNGMKVVLEQDCREYVARGEEGFEGHLNIWSIVAETRGKQLVEDHYITEAQRLLTLEEYRQWCATDAQSMELVLRATHATS